MRRRANPGPTRTIALVGLMGVGKSSVGRRLANRLKLPFADGDVEIEEAAGMTVSEIFAALGEAEFRAGEARVIRRLLEGPPLVLATGGGAMMNPETRALLKERADTVWLRADLAVIAERVARRFRAGGMGASDRPPTAARGRSSAGAPAWTVPCENNTQVKGRAGRVATHGADWHWVSRASVAAAGGGCAY